MTKQLVASKNGTVHVAQRTYTGQNGGLHVVGECNKMVFGPKFIDCGSITCKNCAKRVN